MCCTRVYAKRITKQIKHRWADCAMKLMNFDWNTSRRHYSNFWFMHAQYQDERTWTRLTSTTNVVRLLLRFHPFIFRALLLSALFTIRSWCSFLCDSQRTFNLFMPSKSTLIQMGPVNVCKCTSFAIFLHYFCCSQCLWCFGFCWCCIWNASLFFRENRGCCIKCTVFNK